MKARPVAPLIVRSRIALAALFCATAFSIVAARLVDVMVFGAGPRTAGAASIAHPMRADLVDRNGVLIARDLPVSDLTPRRRRCGTAMRRRMSWRWPRAPTKPI